MISSTGDVRTAGSPVSAAPTLDDLRDALDRLAAHDGADLDEAALVDHLTVMEQLKCALAAAQARVTVTLSTKRSEREEATGVPADQHCRGLAAEVALARHESPVRGARSLGLAKALVHEMPHTLAALTRGEISEWRATLVVRETASSPAGWGASATAGWPSEPARSGTGSIRPRPCVGSAARAPTATSASVQRRTR